VTFRLQNIHLLDAVVAAWVALWIVCGISVAREVQGLTKLSQTVVRAGTALDKTGQAVAGLRSLPLVGGRIGTVEDEARAAARSAKRSGRESRKNIENLSVLLGIAIAVAPSVPALALYLPFRLTRRVGAVTT